MVFCTLNEGQRAELAGQHYIVQGKMPIYMSKQSIHIVLSVVVIVCLLVITLILSYSLGFFGSSLKGEKSFDFGVVSIERPHTVLEHTFLLTNSSGHTLKLKSAVPSCGCTTADWPTEAVPDGEVLAVPVTLKLQRSRYRSSKVRLVFETGEVVVLHIEGAGRFVQRMRSLPPTIKVVDGMEEGTISVLSVEWFELSKPPMPTFIPPDNVIVETDSWMLGTAGDPHRMTPNVWTLRLRCVLDGELKGGSQLQVDMEESKTLLIPLEQVDSIDRPNSIWNQLND